MGAGLQVFGSSSAAFLEVEQAGLELMTIWDVVIAGGSLMRQAACWP